MRPLRTPTSVRPTLFIAATWSSPPDLLPGPDKWGNETAATFQGRGPVTTTMILGRERLRLRSHGPQSGTGLVHPRAPVTWSPPEWELDMAKWKNNLGHIRNAISIDYHLKLKQLKNLSESCGRFVKTQLASPPTRNPFRRSQVEPKTDISNKFPGAAAAVQRATL